MTRAGEKLEGDWNRRWPAMTWRDWLAVWLLGLGQIAMIGLTILSWLRWP